MSDVTVSVEAVEEVRPELAADLFPSSAEVVVL